MKKDDDSSVSIKQIIVTAIFLTFITFGGLNAYRIGYVEEQNTIHTIESANLNIEEYEVALVENTEDDIVYSENVKFLAAKMVDSLDSTHELQNEVLKEKNDTSYSEKVVSRGNLVREQIATEIAEEILIEAVTTIQMEASKEQESGDNDIKEVESIVTEVPAENQDNSIAQEDTIIQENIGVPTEYIKTIDVKATAYCLCKKCCGKNPSHPAYGITASGLRIIPGTGMKVVASDPSVIPLGTEVYIEGLYGASDYGYALVADTGSAIKNLKIDLYMDTHQMALNWGVKTVRVYVLDK